VIVRAVLLGMALLTSFAVMAGEKGAARDEAEVTASRLKVDHEKRRAEFEGNVKAVYGALTLRCDKMSLTYDEEGGVASLTASGKVVVTRGDTRATAKTATLETGTGLLILEGDPVLVRGDNRLEGKRIRVYLKSGQLDIEEARGTFHLNQKAAP
jgi:lipopolysaccharide export system protein LptA